MTALTSASLTEIAATGQVAVPGYPLEERQIGIVHFGVGGFHRAHQAMYLDRLMNAAATATGRSAGWACCPGDSRMRDALTSQDGLYTLVTKAPDGTHDPRVIGAIGKYLFAPDDPAAVLAQMTDPAVRIVSLTVTEGGYNYNPSTGRFQYETEAVAADLCTRFDLEGAVAAGSAGENAGGAEHPAPRRASADDVRLRGRGAAPTPRRRHRPVHRYVLRQRARQR